ncbi:hypothetical protein BDV59DRAFT_172460 [Aspergillus ambiguus]|uniref:uncharacterized protein n=1 Tax=Aspergillus ambiguus TaxID=176160 RepID=UPI003CCDAA43
MEWSMRVVNIVQAAFDSILEKSAYSLEESSHAPRATPKPSHRSSPSSAARPRPSSHSSFSSSSPTLVPSCNPPSSISDLAPVSPEPSSMAPVANIDDVEGFMAAARALKFPETEKGYMSSVTSPGDPSSNEDQNENENENRCEPGTKHEHEHDAVDAFQSSSNEHDHNVSTNNNNNIDNDTWGVIGESDVEHVPSIENQHPAASVHHFNGINGPTEFQTTVSLAGEVGSVAATDEKEPLEDREHLTTFKTWGVPEVRDKSAARVRRVILKGLPSSWTTPAKVLSLVHGGLIEMVSLRGAGSAHVVFCDADACKAFYDKYPNGIDLDKDRKMTVFVDIGDDVDVVSSQLSFHLSVGATRVVRAVGADMGLSMVNLMQLASAQNRKVEKILDHYIPGDARHVVFRFCSIDDAVRFRSTIIRDEMWEQCNVQYAADPCEMATGGHAD